MNIEGEHVMPVQEVEKLSPTERQRRRLEAAEKYLDGELTEKEYEDTFERLKPQYRPIIIPPRIPEEASNNGNGKEPHPLKDTHKP